jgi:hypothetical protein
MAPPSGLDLAQLTRGLSSSQAEAFRRLLEAQADTPNQEDQAYILLRRVGLSDADATRAIRDARRRTSL